MWRSIYKTRFCILNDTLAFEFLGEDGKLGYTYPVGKDPDALAALMLRELGPVRFCLLTPDECRELQARYPHATHAEFERDWVDYIYHAEDMVSLVGRAFSGQRNHINKFKKLYPDHRFVEINHENLDDAVEFCRQYYSDNPPASDELIAERDAIFELLENFEAYAQIGGLLHNGERFVGISIGEIVGDTLIIHTEKAYRSVEGSYPTLFNSFAKRFCTEGVRFINREEDCGQEGLRTSKLSYHPCLLLEKWSLTV